MIYEYLTTGKKNARPARWLADVIGCSTRDISRAAENERRAGIPICASTDSKPGYYLAADAEELEEYCNRLKHRGVEIFKTRQSLIKALKQMEAEPLPKKE